MGKGGGTKARSAASFAPWPELSPEGSLGLGTQGGGGETSAVRARDSLQRRHVRRVLHVRFKPLSAGLSHSPARQPRLLAGLTSPSAK